MEATSDNAAENSQELNDAEHAGDETGKDLEGRVADSDTPSSRTGNYRACREWSDSSKEGKYHSKKSEGKNIDRLHKKNNSTIDGKARFVSSHHSPRVERSDDGAGVLVCYENPETGEKEFLFEEKPYDYAIASERGKLSIPGGHLDRIDGRLEDSREAVTREIEEEVEDPRARAILRHKLGQKSTHDYVLPEPVDRKIANTYIYIIRITSPLEWHIIKNSRSADGTGPFRTVRLQDFLEGKVTRGTFAFTQGDFMFDYVSRKYGVTISKELSHNGHSAHNLILFKSVNLSPALNPNGGLQDNKPGTSTYSAYNLPTSSYKAA